MTITATGELSLLHPQGSSRLRIRGIDPSKLTTNFLETLFLFETQSSKASAIYDNLLPLLGGVQDMDPHPQESLPLTPRGDITGLFFAQLRPHLGDVSIEEFSLQMERSAILSRFWQENQEGTISPNLVTIATNLVEKLEKNESRLGKQFHAECLIICETGKWPSPPIPNQEPLKHLLENIPSHWIINNREFLVGLFGDRIEILIDSLLSLLPQRNMPHMNWKIQSLEWLRASLGAFFQISLNDFLKPGFFSFLRILILTIRLANGHFTRNLSSRFNIAWVVGQIALTILPKLGFYFFPIKMKQIQRKLGKLLRPLILSQEMQQAVDELFRKATFWIKGEGTLSFTFPPIAPTQYEVDRLAALKKIAPNKQEGSVFRVSSTHGTLETKWLDPLSYTIPGDFDPTSILEETTKWTQQTHPCWRMLAICSLPVPNASTFWDEVPQKDILPLLEVLLNILSSLQNSNDPLESESVLASLKLFAVMSHLARRCPNGRLTGFSTSNQPFLDTFQNHPFTKLNGKWQMQLTPILKCFREQNSEGALQIFPDTGGVLTKTTTLFEAISTAIQGPSFPGIGAIRYLAQFYQPDRVSQTGETNLPTDSQRVEDAANMVARPRENVPTYAVPPFFAILAEGYYLTFHSAVSFPVFKQRTSENSSDSFFDQPYWDISTVPKLPFRPPLHNHLVPYFLKMSPIGSEEHKWIRTLRSPPVFSLFRDETALELFLRNDPSPFIRKLVQCTGVATANAGERIPQLFSIFGESLENGEEDYCFSCLFPLIMQGNALYLYLKRNPSFIPILAKLLNRHISYIKNNYLFYGKYSLDLNYMLVTVLRIVNEIDPNSLKQFPNPIEILDKLHHPKSNYLNFLSEYWTIYSPEKLQESRHIEAAASILWNMWTIPLEATLVWKERILRLLANQKARNEILSRILTHYSIYGSDFRGIENYNLEWSGSYPTYQSGPFTYDPTIGLEKI
ncbi:MAG: hypothetical protein LVR00_05910 [Rhabdochlamydiaceae bacterium]|jgi:hypothetical protein